MRDKVLELAIAVLSNPRATPEELAAAESMLFDFGVFPAHQQTKVTVSATDMLGEAVLVERLYKGLTRAQAAKQLIEWAEAEQINRNHTLTVKARYVYPGA